MATVNKAIADKIIEGNGYYMDDPRVLAVVKYTNAFGNEAYAICYSRRDLERYSPTEYVQNPEIVWRAE